MNTDNVLENLEYCFKIGNANCRQFLLEGIVNADEVKGDRELNDDDDDYFDHTYIDQYSSYEDDFHGWHYIPVSKDSTKYFKFNYYA